MKVAIDSDDAGLGLKKAILEFLRTKGADIYDLDYTSRKSGAFYPEIGYHLALKVKNHEYDRGILICGTGLGMCMIANKVSGVYAGVCHDVYSAERLVKSNDAQVITLGARVIGIELAKMIVTAWLESEFQKGSSLPKVRQMRQLERQSFHSLR